MFPPSSSGFAFAVHAQGAQSAKAHEAVFIKRRLAGKTQKKRDARTFSRSSLFFGCPHHAPIPYGSFGSSVLSCLLACRQPLLSVLALTATLADVSNHFHALPLLPATRLAPRKRTSNGIQGAIGTGEPRGIAVRRRDEERRFPCSDSNCSAGRGCTKRPPTCRRVVAQETRVN